MTASQAGVQTLGLILKFGEILTERQKCLQMAVSTSQVLLAMITPLNLCRIGMKRFTPFGLI